MARTSQFKLLRTTVANGFKFLVQSALVIAIPSLDKRFDSTHSTTGTVAPCLNNRIGTREPYSVKKETP